MSDHTHDTTLDTVAAAPQVVPPSTRQTRRRRGPAALEREADRTAEAFLAGATGLAAKLTNSDAASIGVSGSVGRPLDPIIRGRLEHGLGADLAGVRIHDDAAAHRYVSSEGADALTAGRDIFFGPHSFHPDTDEGVQLLVHEVAHALQQTGRTSVGGRRRVTDVSGDGPVQAQDRFLDRFAPAGGPAATPAQKYETIAIDHGGTEPGSPIENYHAEVGRILGGRIDAADADFQSFSAAVARGEHGATTVEEQSYLLDVLKVGLAWDAAASLIEDSDNVLHTAATSSTFESWLRSGGRSVNWPARIVPHVEGLRLYRDYMYGAFRIFLVRPDLPTYRLGQARINAMWASDSWASDLVPNERVTLAARDLMFVDEQRYLMCREADEWSGVNERSESEVARQFIANPVFRAGRRVQQLTPRLEAWRLAGQQSGSLLLQLAGAWFTDRHERATEFWNAAVQQWLADREHRGSAGRMDVSDERRAELARSLRENPVVRRSTGRVALALIRFLRPDADAPGTVAQHASRVDVLVRVLDRESTAVQADLSEYRLDDPTRARADLVPWWSLRLELLRQSLRGYSSGDDTDTFIDAREGHRLGIAIEARILALEIADASLELAALGVQRNLAGGESRLVLTTDWERPARSDLSKLRDDFPSGVAITDDIVIHPVALELFYDELYMGRLADSISMLLDPDIAPAMQDTLVLESAGRAASEAPRAVRWTVERSAWELHPDEDRTVADIVQTHPKSRAQLPTVTDSTVVAYPDRDLVASFENARLLRNETVAWELPAWDRLALQIALALHEIEFIAERLGPVISPVPWLLAAEELIGGPDGPTREAARRRISNHMYQRALEQRRRLGTNGMPPGLLRAATNHDREVAARRIRSVLGPYDGTISGWELPNQALDLIEQFHRYAAPASDNVPQTAALLVEVASSLRQAFVREAFWGQVVIEEDRYDIVTGYYGFLVFAEHWLTGRGRRSRLLSNFLTMTDGEATTALRDLRAVHAAFDRVRARIQRDMGFEVASGGLRSLHYPFIVTPDREFGTDGSVVTISRIFRRFRYHPPYGRRGGVIDGVEQGARSEAMIIDPETGDPIAAGIDLIEVRINENPVVIKVPAFDGSPQSEQALHALDFLWRAVEDQAFILSMENLQEVIEGSFELALDAAEFVPGAGQALMVGRIVASVAMFLASADFEDIKAALSGEVVEQINGVVAEITDTLSPDQLWLFLLFDLNTDVLDRLRRRNSTSARARRVARRRSGKFAKIMRGLMRLGSMIGIQLERMHGRLQPPLRNTQAFVVAHPVVGMLVDLASDAVLMATRLPSPDDIVDFGADLQRNLSNRIESLVREIEGFELPHDLIPLDLMVSAILSLIIERFGRKARVIETVLSATGAMDQIGAMIADEMRSLGLDPNDVWVAEAKPLVDGVLNDARRDLLDGIYGALALIGLDSIVRPDHEEIGTVDDPDGLEHAGEAAPAFSIGRDGAIDDVVSTGGDVIPPGPGAPLPPPVRRRAEQDLGHRFRHVRMHRRSVGDGIDAITRGSHVVMRPGLSVDSGRGADVLRHELGHVVQHTQAERPTRGRAGTTVRFDPAAERHADVIGSAPWPLGGDLDAAAPALSPDVLSNVLRRLASYSDLREFQSDIHSAATALPDLTPEQGTQISHFKSKLVAALRSPMLPVRGIPTAGGDVEARVRHHASLAGDKIRDLARGDHDGVERLARRALREVTQRRRAGVVAAREYRLVPSDLRRLTEGYLLVRTGLICEVRLPRGLPAFELGMSGADDLDVRVKGLFMGAVTKSSRLWQLLLDPGGQLAIGTTHRGAAVDGGGARNSFHIAGAAEQSELYQALIAYMRAVGPRRRVLQRSRFAILDELIEAAVDRRALGTDVPTDQLPRPIAYIEATPGSSHGRISGGAEIALRIATHGRLTTAGTSTFSTLDRESHHTTQYLFAEYLTNRVTGRHPFFADEPGLEMSGARPHKLYRADGRAAIEIGDLHGPDGQRGNPMPAILLASATHQRGNLHVNRTVPDDNSGASNQSNTVDRWFRSKAPRVRAVEATAPAGVPPSTVGSMPAAARERNQELVDGVEEVYRIMRSMMLSALERGLVEHEKPYYETIAARRRDRLDANEDLDEDWQLDVGDLGRVHRAARANNDEVMERYGVRVSP